MASFLRTFKAINHQQLIYDSINEVVIKPIINMVVKQAFAAKSETINFMKGDVTVKLPFEIYLEQMKNILIQGVLARLLNLTSNAEEYNYVEGYDFISLCFWPSFLKILD